MKKKSLRSKSHDVADSINSILYHANRKTLCKVDKLLGVICFFFVLLILFVIGGWIKFMFFM